MKSRPTAAARPATSWAVGAGLREAAAQDGVQPAGGHPLDVRLGRGPGALAHRAHGLDHVQREAPRRRVQQLLLVGREACGPLIAVASLRRVLGGPAGSA